MEDDHKTQVQLIEELAQLQQNNAELSAGYDVTEWQKVVDALRVSEARYARATRAGQVGVWDWDLETNAMYIDPFVKGLLGFADNEIRNNLDDWGDTRTP